MREVERYGRILRYINHYGEPIAARWADWALVPVGPAPWDQQRNDGSGGRDQPTDGPGAPDRESVSAAPPHSGGAGKQAEPAAALLGTPPVRHGAAGVSSILGFEVHVDPTLLPGVIELRGPSGTVRGHFSPEVTGDIPHGLLAAEFCACGHPWREHRGLLDRCPHGCWSCITWRLTRSDEDPPEGDCSTCGRPCPSQRGMHEGLLDCVRALRIALAAEEHDVDLFIGHCTEIYSWATDGRITKPNTLPIEVKGVGEDLEMERTRRAIEEETAPLRNELLEAQWRLGFHARDGKRAWDIISEIDEALDRATGKAERPRMELLKRVIEERDRAVGLTRVSHA